MKTRYEMVDVSNAEFTVDVTSLRKTEEMFFNATQMAKPFGKLVKNFLILDSTKEYIEARLKKDNSKEKISANKNYEDLVKVKRGRYGGTYLHNKLVLRFAGWLDPAFQVNLDDWIFERIEQEREWKNKRLEARTGYLPMTEAIMEAHQDPKFYHYSNEADMINKIVLGCTTKQYKERNNVDSVRESVSADELAHIERLQQTNTGLIEAEMSYEDRKNFLINLYEKRLIKYRQIS